MHPGSQIEAVYLCREPVDFRKAIGGLSALVEQSFGRNPFSTALHVFINAKRDKIKAIYWHRNGFCLWYVTGNSAAFLLSSCRGDRDPIASGHRRSSASTVAA